MLDESLALPLLDQTSLVESADIQLFPVDPLIYDDTIDTSTIQNVLFINSAVNDFQQYANANTFPIIYSRMSTSEQILELLTIKFQNISRIAMVCHFSEEPHFLNNELLFSDTNTQFIIDLVKQFNVTNIDFLACSTLQSQLWTSYYTKLRDATGTQIGASDDNTGNLKYGGDWVLESTQEDVQTVYFNDLIQNYASLLLSITYLNLNYTTVGTNATVIAPTTGQVTALNGIINIPSTFIDNGITYNVVAIAASAFQSTAITSVIIPDSVLTIGSSAFNTCSSLKTVVLPNFITSISDSCFLWCPITSIIIPSLVTSIGNSAFYGCYLLLSIILPYGLLSIGTDVFGKNGSLTSIIIPDSVTTIGNNAFYEASALLYIKLSNSLTRIPNSCFYQCPFVTLVIPASVTSIGNVVFNCPNLISLVFLGTTIPSFGTTPFLSTTNVAFYMNGTDATNIAKIPANFTIKTTIIANSFTYGDINYTSSYNYVTVAPYQSTSLKGALTIPNTVSDASGVKYVVKSIGTNAFYGCTQLYSIVIPSYVSDIGDFAFNGCSLLYTITIPSLVVTIGANAFTQCPNLKSVIFLGKGIIPTITAPNFDTIGNTVFYVTGTDTANIAKFSSFFTSQTIQTTKSFTSNGLNYTTSYGSATIGVSTGVTGALTIPSTIIDTSGITYNVIAIAVSAFQSTAITSVIIPDSVLTIGSSAFKLCASLKTATLPKWLTVIAAEMFINSGLTAIAIPSLVTSIGDNAFYGCQLPSIILPYGLLSIGAGVFGQNGAITSIVIPNSVTSFLGSFYSDINLSYVQLSRGLTTLTASMLQSTGIKYLVIPSKISYIGNSACQSCQSLSYVTIPAAVTNIGVNAFYDCSVLTRVYFYGNFPTTIGANCFAIGAAHTAYYISGATGFSTVPASFVGVATFIQQTPASNVQTVISSLNQVTISWSAATSVVNVPSTGTTIQYEITYWNTSTPTITITTPLISDTSYNITGLLMATNYTFQVIAYNDIGPSIPTANVSRQMTPEFPLPPTAFKLTPRNGKILISQIVDGANNGAIIDYHSYSTSLDGISNWSTDVSFSTISALIPLLTNEQIYYIRLNAHNSAGTSTLYSSIMSAIPLINQPYTGSVTIDGWTNQYQTLTANTSMIADIDELGPFLYQWNVSGVDISGVTSETYILTQEEVGKTVGVTVKYTDLQGTLESVSSIQTAIVTSVNNPVSGSVTITGLAETSQVLTANTSMLADLEGLGLFLFQWDASGVDISGATQSTYTLSRAELGKTVGVTVKYTDGQGFLESISSVKTAIVIYGITTSDFVFKILNSVWSVPTTKTFPIISSGLSFGGSATLNYSVTGPDASLYMTVAVSYTSFTDNGTTLDGINCKTQLFNGATFSSIPSFEIIQFGSFPLSRAPGLNTSASTPFGVFSDFKGKISSTNPPLILPNTSLAFAFCSASANTLASVNFGNIGSWNMSNVTNMSYMFYNDTAFNKSLSSWDTSKVTNMSFMFYNDSAFNQSLSSWDTSKVTNMEFLFCGCSVFNNGFASGVGGSLNWDTGKVTTFALIFQSANAFNQYIGNWNTSSAIIMNNMFLAATNFNNGAASGIGGSPLNWDTKNVTTFSYFCASSAFNQNVGKWNTSSVTAMDNMFNNASKFNNGSALTTVDPSNAFYWNTGNVTTMISMFQNASKFNQHIGTFDTRKITTANMLNMLASATAFNAATTNMPRAILTNGTLTRLSYTQLTGYSYTSDELNASKPTSLSASRLGTNLTINFTTPSYPGVNAITKYNYSIDAGTNWIDASGTTSPLVISVPEMDTLTIKLRAADASNNYGAISSETIVLIFVYLPALTAIADPINLGSVSEDASNVEISFTQLFQDTSSNSINSSVNAFIVKSVTTGSLKIGVNPWDAILNCTIDASNTAYWTPVLKANGKLTAFKIVARDAFMEQSTTPFNVNVMVTAVNDAPTITSVSSATIFEKVSTSTVAYTVTASDVDAGTTLSYSFNGGVDDDLFNIDSSNGAVTFKVSPKYETPGDENLDNVYNIIVRVSDGIEYSIDKEVAITVINVNDAPVAPVLINQSVIQDVSFN